MWKAIEFHRPCERLTVAAAAVMTVVAFMTAGLTAQEQDKPRSGTAEGRLEGDEVATERVRPQLGLIVAPSPGGSPLVLRVQPGSPADQAGVRHGDFILSLDGKEITSPKQLRSALHDLKAAERATVTIWRNGQERSHEIDLSSQQRPRKPRLARRAWLGAMIRTAGDPGVEIARIYLDSPADKAGLKAGDRITQIDGHDVSSPQAVTARIRRFDPGEKVTLRVERDGQELTVEVEVGNLEDFHEHLFGKRFRQKFDDFHQMFDPDFDGVPEGVFSFQIPTDDELTLRELIREMRQELREFRNELRQSDKADRDSSD